jgi:hypothetical protein
MGDERMLSRKTDVGIKKRERKPYSEGGKEIKIPGGYILELRSEPNPEKTGYKMIASVKNYPGIDIEGNTEEEILGKAAEEISGILDGYIYSLEDDLEKLVSPGYKFLYEFPHLLFCENLPDNNTLRDLFEFEWEATVGERNKQALCTRVWWDCQNENRKPRYDILTVIAAILKDDELFQSIVAHRTEVAYEHWSQQRSSGVSREDAGDPVPWNVHLKRSCEEAISLLERSARPSNKTTEMIHVQIEIFHATIFRAG